MSRSKVALRSIPYEYNEDVKQLDEQILALAKQRQELTGKKRYMPGGETLIEWAKELKLEPLQIHTLLQALHAQVMERPRRSEDRPLQSVLPIMKRTKSDGCEYLISHAMQYEDESIVKMDIRYMEDSEQEEVELVPCLTLEIIGGEYTVQPISTSTHSGKAQLEFSVMPPLPEPLEGLEFSLVPGTTPFFAERNPLRIKLDKQIDFE
ncbi:hypothetical protein ACE6ED_21875 [Paenibacillus sp. CN-4]|uniref:hypothetical protein n=1 Tax=Paenibacillus nanchangensis TaxID=3348343 RepID=UPI00397C76AA